MRDDDGMTNRPWLPFFVLLVGVLALGIYPVDRGLVAAMQQGDRAVTEQRYSAALRAYALAAHHCPGCPQPHVRQGAVYVAQERYDEAQTAYLDAIRLGGLSDAAMEGLAALHAAEGSERLAIGELERVLSHRSGRGDLWARLGEAHRALGEGALSRQAFERALVLDITDHQRQVVHDRLGILCLEAGSAEPGVRCAREHFEAVGRGPDPALAGHADRLVQALSRLDQGAGSGDRALAQARVGEALYHHGDLDMARHWFESALALEPYYVDAHAYLGHVSSLLGDARAAVAHLERAIALAPAYTLPRYLLGMHHVRRGGWVTGRELLEQAHDLDPDDPAICAAIADAHLRGDTPWYDVAEQWFQAAADRAPGDPRFRLLLAQFYVLRGIDPGGRGVAAAQAAIDLAPESSEAHETMGWAYHLDGQSARALEPLLHALDLASGEQGTASARARIYYRLGEVYRALGQTAQARQHLERAADLDWHGAIGERARQTLIEVR